MAKPEKLNGVDVAVALLSGEAEAAGASAVASGARFADSGAASGSAFAWARKVDAKKRTPKIFAKKGRARVINDSP